jgi:hypothetical protein
MEVTEIESIGQNTNFIPAAVSFDTAKAIGFNTACAAVAVEEVTRPTRALETTRSVAARLLAWPAATFGLALVDVCVVMSTCLAWHQHNSSIGNIGEQRERMAIALAHLATSTTGSMVIRFEAVSHQRIKGARHAKSRQAGRSCTCRYRRARGSADNLLLPDLGGLCSLDGTSPYKTYPQVFPRDIG